MSSRRSRIKPSHLLRSLYATPLNVYKNDLGLALDISYITPKIIVCSYPVTKYPKLMYRNSLEDLITFLDVHHGRGNWKIYNFKVEQGSADYEDDDILRLAINDCSAEVPQKTVLDTTVPIGLAAELLYKHGFDRQLSLSQLICRIGWMDHCPPPFLLLQEIIDDIHQYLSQSESCVAVLHCKMGKGRSGTICIAYMMKYLECPLSESRDIFMNSRFRPGVSRGVAIISQLRYLRYHEIFLCYDPLLRKQLLDQIFKVRFQLKSVYLSQPSGIIFSHPCVASIKVQTFNSARDGLIDMANLETDSELLGQSKSRGLTICFPLELDVSDVRLEFGLIARTSNLINSFTSLASCSHCWLNLYWETLKCSRDHSRTHFTLSELRNQQSSGQEYVFVIKWSELDGTKGTNNRGLKLFESITLKWSIL